MTPTDLIDPNQRPLYAAPLIGEILVDGAYQSLEITPGPEGCIMGYSPALGVSLAVRDKPAGGSTTTSWGISWPSSRNRNGPRCRRKAEAQAERELRVAERRKAS